MPDSQHTDSSLVSRIRSKKRALSIFLVVVSLLGVGATVSKHGVLFSYHPIPIASSPTLLGTASTAASQSTPDTASTSPALVASSSTSAILIPGIKKLPSQAAAAVQAVPSAQPSSVVQARKLSSAGSKLLGSMVNIVCVSGVKNIPSISGTGVIIDSRGIILTAAHVAQLFLLQDYLGKDKVECVIRNGSPARRAYLGEPIYVSPKWVLKNPATLRSVSPLGTGEDDFAVLGITDTATTTPLPDTFAARTLATDEPNVGDPISIGSYGAQYLTSAELNYALYPILVFGSIKDRFTFKANTVDLFSVEGSAASQEGSSGGGIVNANGQVMGIITTSSIAGNLATRSLNIITIGHIRRSFASDTGTSFDASLQNQSITALIAGFAGESKHLGSIIYQNL